MIEAKNGTADGLIGLWYSPERSKTYFYSEPYYTNEIGFVSSKSKTITYKGLNDLGAYRIGVRQGASFGEEFDNAYFLDKYPAINSLSMLKMIALGRLDMGIGDRLILSRVLQKDDDLKEKLRFMEPIYTQRPLHMALTRTVPGHQKIVENFNRELTKMKLDGRLQKIIDGYKH